MVFNYLNKTTVQVHDWGTAKQSHIIHAKHTPEINKCVYFTISLKWMRQAGSTPSKWHRCVRIKCLISATILCHTTTPHPNEDKLHGHTKEWNDHSFKNTLSGQKPVAMCVTCTSHRCHDPIRSSPRLLSACPHRSNPKLRNSRNTPPTGTGCIFKIKTFVKSQNQTCCKVFENIHDVLIADHSNLIIS